MITMIPQIPEPPTPQDPPAQFNQKAADSWAGLYAAVPKMNQQAGEIEQIGAAATAAAGQAAVDSDLALGYKNEAGAARTAAQGAAATAGQHAATAVQAGDDAAQAAVRAEEAAAAAESITSNAVLQTSVTGAALLPEGGDAQRPSNGEIPAGQLVVRGNTQSAADYKPEFWDRVAAAWKTLADRTWVGLQISSAINQLRETIDDWLGFTIIHLNGGTAAAPGTVAANSRYVTPNPFPGVPVICEVEIRLIATPRGDWFKPGWSSSNTVAYGVSAGLVGDSIVVQTGSNGVTAAAAITGATVNPGGVVATAEVRVKVWKLIKGGA